jgi:hypothetical protein
MPRRKNTTDCKGLLFLLSGSDDPMLGLSEELWSKLMEAAIASSFLRIYGIPAFGYSFSLLADHGFSGYYERISTQEKTSNQRRRHASSSFRHPAR